MDDDSLRIEVEPTRIADVGIGTFLVLAGGILCTLLCIGGAMVLKQPGKLCTVATILYGGMIIYLSNAKRRSRWVVSDDVADVDHLWLTHILIGSLLVAGCVVSLLTWIRYDFLSVVYAKEIG